MKDVREGSRLNAFTQGRSSLLRLGGMFLRVRGGSRQPDVSVWFYDKGGDHRANPSKKSDTWVKEYTLARQFWETTVFAAPEKPANDQEVAGASP